MCMCVQRHSSMSVCEPLRSQNSYSKLTLTVLLTSGNKAKFTLTFKKYNRTLNETFSFRMSVCPSVCMLIYSVPRLKLNVVINLHIQNFELSSNKQYICYIMFDLTESVMITTK